MKIIRGDEVKRKTVDHPYESNPDYMAKLKTFYFSKDEKLIAGLRISIGGWMLQANLQDELRFFSEAAVTHG